MNQLTIGFDYGTLDAETRKTVETCRDDIRRREKRAAEDIVEIGLRLIEAKDALDHGQFMSWVTAEFGWSQRTARRFMFVAGRFGDSGQIGHIAPSALYELASGNVPDEIREEFVNKVQSGEPVRYTDVRARLDELKPPRSEPVIEAEDDDEEEWHEPPPLFSIVDTQTGEIIREVQPNQTVTVSDIPSGSMPVFREKSREEMAFDRLAQMSIITDLDPVAVADAASEYRADSARLFLNRMTSLEAWAAAFTKRLRKNMDSPIRAIR